VHQTDVRGINILMRAFPHPLAAWLAELRNLHLLYFQCIFHHVSFSSVSCIMKREGGFEGRIYTNFISKDSIV
jgi:hypothetical protein